MPSPSQFHRQQALRKKLRELTGLPESHGFHPAPKAFFRQDEAVNAWEGFVDSGEYLPSQIGLFAQEIGEGGKRKFMVDTFAGFAIDHAPDHDTGFWLGLLLTFLYIKNRLHKMV